MTSSPIAAPDRSRGRLLLIAGQGLAVLGIAAFAVRLSLQRLTMPWYMPGLAVLGVVLIAMSLRKRRTAWRVVALVAVLLLAGAEIAALNAVRLPPYAGPITVGRPFPAFASKRADGTLFAQNDLAGDQGSVLVFFRGRW